MVSHCVSPFEGNAARFTRLDSCGRPAIGECGQVVTDGIITATITPEYRTGAEIQVSNFAGRACVDRKKDDTLRWYTIELEWCEVDFDLFTMFQPNWRSVLNGQGERVGFAVPDTVPTNAGVAIEIWTEIDTGEDPACAGGAAGTWGYVLLPWVIGGTLDSYTIAEGDGVKMKLTGRTRRGNAWGRGVNKVQLNSSGVSDYLLAPMDPTEHHLFAEVDVAPPVPACGCVPLVAPDIPLSAVAVEDTNDATGHTTRLTWDNFGHGPVSIVWHTGDAPVVVADYGALSHLYVTTGAKVLTVTDVTEPLRTVTINITIPYP